MDKRSLLAVALMTVVVIAWLFYSSVNTQYPDIQKQKQKKVDSALAHKKGNVNTSNELKKADSLITNQSNGVGTNDSLIAINKFGSYFAPFANGKSEVITIETNLLKARLNTKGAVLTYWELKDYKQWNGYPSQLIWSNDPERKGELYLTFVTKEAKKIDTRDLYFNLIGEHKNYYRLGPKDSLILTANLEIEPGKYIQKTFTFFGDKYIVNTNVTLNNMEDIIPSRGYNYNWSDGLKYQEMSSVDESSSAEALASLNGDILSINASGDEPEEDKGTGLIDYAAVKIKYFGMAITPMPYKTFDGTVDLSGSRQKVKKEGIVERYDVSFRIPYNGGKSSNDFQVYLGPLDYDILSQIGLSQMVYFGWSFIRYIGEYFILPLFLFFHKFIPNWGLTIIVFSIFMKLILYPLSVQQMRSAQKMKLLAPEMERIREKYKDDNKRQQKETMNLYSQYGINPAGGCLPMLLQMPILYALWSVLRTSIALRQTDFIFWITDLSLPDVLVHFGFSFMGIKFLSGLALLMGITMFLQQKLTITDPKQKAMIYFMPIMFTLIFSNLPAGLNLYYFMFNLLGIIQQVYINKFSKKSPTLADLKKSPKKKEGWIQKKMREAQEMAESQGRSIPGKTYTPKKKGSKKPPSKRKR